MTEQKTAMAKAEEISKAGFILTKSGVMFIGSNLLGNKLAAIMCEAIQVDDLHGLSCLTIRDDNFPIDDRMPVFGVALADTYSVAINLEHCWHRACVKASKNDVNLSFMGILWVSILSTLGHELDHLTVASNDRELYEAMRVDEEGYKELEESAQLAGKHMILTLAKKFDIEPPAAGDLGWIGVKLMALFTDESTRELDWVIKARKDLEAGIMYAEPENDIEIKTFREFVKRAYASDEDEDVEVWEQPTSAVNLVAYLDNGVVEEFKANPVETPVAEAVVVEANEVPDEMIAFIANDGTPVVVAGENNSAVETVAAAQAVVDAVPAELEVPLPAPVVAQAAAVSAAAATGIPPVQETPTTYTPHNLSPEVQAATIKAVWQTLYHHIFTKCGWQQNPQTGRFMFTNAAAVLEGVNIQHIIANNGADNFIMEYDTLDADGKYAAEICQGMIRGRTTSKQGLPSYSLYLNIGGQRIKRTFMPQNPEKRDAQNAYTNAADLAGAGGHMIVWVFKDEVPDAAPFKEKCAVTIKDNVYEVMS